MAARGVDERRREVEVEVEVEAEHGPPWAKCSGRDRDLRHHGISTIALAKMQNPISRSVRVLSEQKRASIVDGASHPSFCGSSGAICTYTGLVEPHQRIYYVRQVRMHVRLVVRVCRRQICTPINHDLPGGCRRAHVGAGGMALCRSPSGAQILPAFSPAACRKLVR
jgi:hypothetical protein